MKHIIFLLLFLPFIGFSQGGTWPVKYGDSDPSGAPSAAGTRLYFNTATNTLFTWEPAPSSTWRKQPKAFDQVSGCAAPAYTPTARQSTFAVNSCTPKPELYQWTGSAWALLNPETLYTEGTGIDITGGVITNTAPNAPDSAWQKKNLSYASKRITDTIQRTAPAIFPVWDKGAVVYNVAAYGIYPGGPTGPDLTTKIRGLLDTVAKHHGGIIQFNQGVYRIDGQITIPFVKPLTVANPGAYDRQPSIYIRGVGAYKTCWNTNPDTIKGTVLLLNFNDGLPNRDTIGKIHSRGAGFLQMSDLNLVSKDTTKTAFLMINYTTVHLNNVSFWGSGVTYNAQAEDAIVCGGDANPQVTNTYNTHFAGYGSVFENCYFYGIRRGWWARAYTNNVVFQNNTFWYSNKGECAIELATNIPGNIVGGNTISGCTVEMLGGYEYFIKLGNSANANTIIGNGTYDPVVETKAFIFIDSFATNNQIFAGYWDTPLFWETNGDRTYIKDRNSIYMNNTSDTTTFGSSFYVGGHSVFRKSAFVREGLTVNHISPFNLRLQPQFLTNYFDVNVSDASLFSISSNENASIFKVHKSALSNSLFIDNFGGVLFNRTAYNNNAGSYIHPEGRAIFKQSVYIDYNWDGSNSYKLKVNGTSLLAGPVEITTTSGGVLMPRLTTAQRNAIGSPPAGLTLFCTDCTATDASTGVMQVWNGSTWKSCW